ncbi:MAG: glycosyltransferase family 4 protein [Verrucomicrobia bacterium]|nr:glycosyltransferase family 4 protein [Verrucomicrobiota bacterium]
MKIALLTTDGRQDDRQYDRIEPIFGTAPEALISGFALIPEAEVHVLSCLQQPVRSPEKLASNIYYHALHVPKIGWLRTGYLGCIRAVRRKLQEIKPDIVHGQGTERDCAVSAVFSGFPNILTLHGNMRVIAALQHAPLWSYAGLTASLERFIVPRTNGVICITRYTQRNVLDLNRRTWIIPNAVDPKFFQIKLQPVDPPIVLCIGVVSTRKNQLKVLEAFTPLAAEKVFKLAFLGKASPSDPYAQAFMQQIARLGWVEHVNHANRELLRSYFAKARMLVLASVEDNCPMVVLEAAAAGIPIVAPRVGGVPELVTEGKNGLLCDPHDAKSIRSCVRRMFEPEFAQAIAVQARKDAEQRFQPKKIADEHLGVYREVLSLPKLSMTVA